YLEALDDTAADLRALGREAELLSPEEVAGHGLDPSSVAGALYTPEEGFLEADEVVEYYAEEASAAGVQIEVGASVTDVVTEDGAVAGVEVDGEVRDADVVVNAAGPWAPRVNALAGVALPLRHTRGPILGIEADEPTRMPFARFERQTYARPFGEAGLYVGHYETEFDAATEVDPDEPRALDDGFRRAADETLTTFLPQFADARPVDEWVGLRTVTPDGRPMVGETGVEGFLVAVGMTGQGVTLAPVAGQLLAERLETGAMPQAAASLSPARFFE
ncbi:MAG TPA: FAD-dependent oxidoreductase, partial [Halobacteriales archaeon]|nr:FAD-dependent oxidoreductase [Halobacteriales archaeon]